MNLKRLQLTLAILKPDLCMRQRAKEAVVSRIKDEKFLLVRHSVTKMTPNKAHEFYAEHKGRFYFDRLVEFMCCGPSECMVLARADAVRHWRALMGPTKPYVAQFTAPHTIRGTHGLTDTRNSTHGSDSAESAEREIAILFPNFDLKGWYQNEEEHFRNGRVTFSAREQIHVVVTQKFRKG